MTGPYTIQFKIGAGWRGSDVFTERHIALMDLDLRDGRDMRGVTRERRVIDTHGNVIKWGRWHAPGPNSEGKQT